MTRTQRLTLLCIGGLVISGVVVAAWPRTAPHPLTWIGGIDSSDSCGKAEIQRYAEVTAETIEGLDPRSSHLDLYRLDSDCLEIWNDPVPFDTDSFRSYIQKKLGPAPAKAGTIQYLFFVQAAALVRENSEKGRQFVVSLGTDGDNDSPKAERAYADAVAALAKDKRVVRVILYGLRPEAKAAMRARFSAFEPNRLRIFDVDERGPLWP